MIRLPNANHSAKAGVQYVRSSGTATFAIGQRTTSADDPKGMSAKTSAYEDEHSLRFLWRVLSSDVVVSSDEI